jgi:hypothetical protein
MVAEGCGRGVAKFGCEKLEPVFDSSWGERCDWSNELVVNEEMK